MKHLNQQATKIAIKLFELMIEHGGNYVLDVNGKDSGIMAVHLEKRDAIITISSANAEYNNVFSIAHYFVQEGDLMSDPYMEFMMSDNLDTVIPILYHQDSPYTYQEALVWNDGKVTAYRPSWQKDMTAFANQWMLNISRQQKIK